MRTAVLLAISVASPIIAENLSQGDRDFMLSHLHATRKQLLDATANLTEAQWKFKPAPEKWSTAGVVEHLALTERALLGMVQKLMAGPAAPPQTKIEDSVILKGMPDRTQRANAPEMLQPSETKGFGPPLVAEFTKARDTSIAWVRDEKGDMRGRSAKSAFGTIDAVQWILYMSAHTERHLAQIMEIRASSGYPR